MAGLATLFVTFATLLAGVALAQEGLKVSTLNTTIANITRMISGEYYGENVLKIASWNLRKQNVRYPCRRDTRDNGWLCRRSEICTYVKDMQPTIIGFQDVLSRQLDDLIRCLTGYRHFSGKQVSVDSLKFNPIFYKKTQRIGRREGLQVTESGTFWLSDTPHTESKLPSGRSRMRATEPRACSWIKLRFRQRSSKRAYNRVMFPKRKVSNKILFLLKIFTNKKEQQAKRASNRRRMRGPRERYLWSTFYVANTELERSDPEIATKQMQILQSHLRTHTTVMDRRRYPIIFMGELTATDRTSVYRAIDDNSWLIDTRYKKFGFGESDRSKTNFIMQSQFRTLTSGVLTDDNVKALSKQMTDARPVFAMLLTDRSPKKSNEKKSPSSSNDSSNNWKA